MLKKTIISLVTLVLLLATTQLALAQQETGTDPSGEDTHLTSVNPAQQDAGQQDANQSQPIGDTQPSLPSVENLMHLNGHNDLVVNCTNVSENLGQLVQGKGIQANNAQLQSELVQLQVLDQLCMQSGFNAAHGG